MLNSRRSCRGLVVGQSRLISARSYTPSPNHFLMNITGFAGRSAH